MRSERVVSLVAGLAAVLAALLVTPDPLGLLRLAAAGLLALGVGVSLLWDHPRAPLLAATLLVAGLAVSPAPGSALWGLAVAALALVSLAAAHAAPRAHAIAPALGVVAAGALLVLGVALLLPRLSVAATPLVLLLAGALLLCLAATLALVRHGGAPPEPAPASE